jgi:biotin transport system permease protein
MMQGLYVAGDTWLHRLPAGIKLAVLFMAGVALFLAHDPVVLGTAAAVGVALVWASGVSGSRVWRQTRGMVPVLVVICLAAAYFDGVPRAIEVLLRLVALVSLAMAVTLTTRSVDMLDVCERVLQPLDAMGWVDASRVSLALSLCLRFVPEIHRSYLDIREAQAARGIRANPIALIVPLVVATLKRADVIAEAIDARGYPPGKATGPVKEGKVRRPS